MKAAVWRFEFDPLEREPFINAMLESIKLSIMTGMPIPDAQGRAVDYLVVLSAHTEMLKNLRSVSNTIQFPIRVNAAIGEFHAMDEFTSIAAIEETPASRNEHTLILRITPGE